MVRSYISFGFISFAIVCGLVLSSASASADVVDEVSITVPVSCTMSGTGMDTHVAKISNRQYNSNIGESIIKAFCNDSEGFAIYAIGYTDDTDGKNVLTSSTLDSVYDIVTGTATSGDTSNWAMKLTTTTSPVPTYPIIVAGSSVDTLKEQNDPDFTVFQAVPDDYTKVAYRTSGTDIGQEAEGATLNTTYQAYISKTQPAGSYTGQVKYVLVYPHTAGAPLCNPGATTIEQVKCMQDISSTNKTTILASMTTDAVYLLYDSRDKQSYHVAKLADNNIWLLDNLAIDLTDPAVQAKLNSSTTNASDATIGYLINGGGTSSDKYPINGVNDDWSSASDNVFSEPKINLSSKDIVPNDEMSVEGDYKVGGYYNFCAATAGSYCYGDGASSGNPSGHSVEDICPAGWRMATGYTTTNEFQKLSKAITGYTSNSYTGSNGATAIRAALHLATSGMFLSGQASNIGSMGYYWTTTKYSKSEMDYATNGITMVVLNDFAARNWGHSIRCLVKP